MELRNEKQEEKKDEKRPEPNFKLSLDFLLR